MNKTGKNPCALGAYILMKGDNNSSCVYVVLCMCWHCCEQFTFINSTNLSMYQFLIYRKSQYGTECYKLALCVAIHLYFTFAAIYYLIYLIAFAFL